MIHTHGYYSDAEDEVANGPEHLVMSQFDNMPILGRFRTKPSRGNEQLVLRDEPVVEFVSDDNFAVFFKSSGWDQIQKLFIIDACFSGGFWEGDANDLASLPKCGLIAAAPETDFSYSLGLGPGQSFFSMGFKSAIDELVGLPAFSLQDLVGRIRFWGQVNPVYNGVISGLNAYWGHVAPGQWNPTSFATSDFQFDFGSLAPAYPTLQISLTNHAISISFATIAGWTYQLQRL